MSSTTKTRYPYIDIARGIFLVLCVWAHARAPYFNYIYLFHMPFFFLLSGYLHNSQSDWKEFFIKKAKGYYIPFFFWNLAATVSRVLFDHMGKKGALKQMIKITLTLEKDGKLLGAIWFLGSLFLVSVIYKTLEVLMKESEHRHLILFLLSIVTAALAYCFTLPYQQSRTVILASFYALGVFLRSSEIDLQRCCKPYIMVITAVLFVYLRKGNEANMGANTYSSPGKFVLTSLLGSYTILSLSVLLDSLGNRFVKKLNDFLAYIGRRGIDLVIWQFVAFWMVTTFQQYLNNGSFAEFMKGKAIADTTNGWWILYFLAGMILPLLWTDLLRKGRLGAFLKKYYIV